MIKLLSNGERVPEDDFMWITTVTDIDEPYPEEESGPGGWYPFAAVDLGKAPENTQPNVSCLVLWRTALPKTTWEKIQKEEEQWDRSPESVGVMDRVSLYAESREISDQEALEELLMMAMDGDSCIELPPKEIQKAFRHAGFTRLL